MLLLVCLSFSSEVMWGCCSYSARVGSDRTLTEIGALSSGNQRTYLKGTMLASLRYHSGTP